jgi:hypothetical protein
MRSALLLLLLTTFALLTACGGGGGGGPAVNQPPVAVLTANPDTGAVPLVVTLNGSGSSDVDGNIEIFQWNLGTAGGVLDLNRPTLTVPISLPFGGASTDLTVTLTVTDDDGLTDTAQVTLNLQRATQTRVAVTNAPEAGTPNTSTT